MFYDQISRRAGKKRIYTLTFQIYVRIASTVVEAQKFGRSRVVRILDDVIIIIIYSLEFVFENKVFQDNKTSPT